MMNIKIQIESFPVVIYLSLKKDKKEKFFEKKDFLNKGIEEQVVLKNLISEKKHKIKCLRQI